MLSGPSAAARDRALRPRVRLVKTLSGPSAAATWSIYPCLIYRIHVQNLLAKPHYNKLESTLVEQSSVVSRSPAAGFH